MTDADFAFINSMFAGNTDGLKTLRKIFLYEVDVNDPIGMSRDMWTTLDLTGLSSDQLVLAVTARQMMIKHLEGALQVLATIAGEKKESPEETLKRLQKDSAK